MKPAANDRDPAFPAMAMDILSNVLSRTDNPGNLGTYLTEEVRDLTGARCVLLFQCQSTPTVTAHQLVSVNPLRMRQWAESPAGNRLVEAVLCVPEAQHWRGDEPSEIAGLLRQEGFELSMGFPLHAGGSRVGAMLVLGLPDEEHVTSVLGLLNNLSAIVALVLRNAILFDKQEQIIQERTAQLRDRNEKLAIELAERKRAEERQREQYSTLRGIIDGLPAPIFSVDRQYRYTSFNAGHAAMMKALYGVEIEQGHSMLDYMTVPEDQEAARHNLDRAAAGEQLAEEAYSGEELRSRRYFHVSHSPIKTDEGEIIGVAVLAQDMTERKSAEEGLRASEEQYRRFVEDDVAGVFITAPDGRVLTCNPAFARMFGFASVDDVLATNVVTIYQDHAARDAVLAELRARGRIDHREMAWQRLDGSPVAAIETAIGDFDEAGELVAIRGYVRDITERKRLEEQLRQSQKMEAIGRLAGGIAHDFNNLLTAINGYADILVAGMAPDEPRRSDVEEIRKAGDRAAALTRQLLAFSRRQVLQPVVIDPSDVVAGIAPMLRRLVGEQIELRTPAAPDLGRVRADPSQIEQVLLNLVVNARDAMPAGGTLTIETANTELDDEYARNHPPVAPGPYVLLAVSDTGTGMDAVTMAHLFEPFFTTKPAGEGTGLGLATVYGIVAQSGGHVTAYSEPGHGSTFKVFLPRVAETVEPRSEAVAEPAASGAETVLVVEDEDAVRSFVERVLGGLGYTVTTARSGAEALALAAGHRGPIDLLVTDVMLPGMNGRELSERLTALRPSLRTLFISGYTEDSIVHRGELGPDVAFLSKPFTPDALGRAVREVFRAQKVVSGGPDR